MQNSAQVDYAIMRAAMQMFNKAQEQLDRGERNAVMQQVNREVAIGKKLLDSDMAAQVVISHAAVEQSVQQLAERFDSAEEFERALIQNALDETRLREALAHELKVEAVLEQLLSQQAQVSSEEIEIYYYQHLDKFELPETRTARHILITINEDFPENSSTAAEKRLQKIEEQVHNNPGAFSELAAKYSECPTAMHDGLLGRIKPGQLYPELDEVLFGMEEGSLSGIIRSPMGLHLLLCEKIHQTGRVTFDEVKESLQAQLEKKKRTRLLREWLQQAA